MGFIRGFTVYRTSGQLLYKRIYKNVPSDDLLLLETNFMSTGLMDILGPLVRINSNVYIFTRIDKLYFVAIVEQHVDVLTTMTFFIRLGMLIKTRIGGPLEAMTFFHNFFTFADIFEESICIGHVELVNENYLSEMSSLKKRDNEDDAERIKDIVNRATGAVPWRTPGTRYANNEVCVDIQEKLNLIISKTGSVLRQDVLGNVMFKSRLGGMPECRFGTNDLGGLTSLPLTTNTMNKPIIAFEDVHFHPCVQLSKYQHNHSIVFIPPEGCFVLMTYRTTRAVSCFSLLSTYKFSDILEINADDKGSDVGKYLEVFVKVSCTIPEVRCARNVIVNIPINPEYAKPLKVECARGKAIYYSESKMLIWRTKQIYGQQSMDVKATFMRSSRDDVVQRDVRPITMDFSIPGFAASGISIRYLRVVEKSGYKTVKWLRYITRAGMVEFRK